MVNEHENVCVCVSWNDVVFRGWKLSRRLSDVGAEEWDWRLSEYRSIMRLRCLHLRALMHLYTNWWTSKKLLNYPSPEGFAVRTLVISWSLSTTVSKSSLSSGALSPHGSSRSSSVIPYPTAFPYGNGMVLHFYQQQDSSTTKTVHRVINRGLKAYV